MKTNTFSKVVSLSAHGYFKSWAYYLSTHVLVASILLLVVAAATLALPKAVVDLLVLTTFLVYGFWLAVRLVKLVFNHVDEISRYDDTGTKKGL